MLLRNWKSPGFRSGWYFFASFRYARLISSSDASGETPKIRCGSSIASYLVTFSWWIFHRSSGRKCWFSPFLWEPAGWSCIWGSGKICGFCADASTVRFGVSRKDRRNFLPDGLPYPWKIPGNTHKRCRQQRFRIPHSEARLQGRIHWRSSKSAMTIRRSLTMRQSHSDLRKRLLSCIS